MESKFGLTVDSALIGLENIDMLKNPDLSFIWYDDKENRKVIEGQDLYASILAIDNGVVVAPTSLW
ncbi:MULTISPECIES: hypothetical protein [Auritidibacter]|uniref:Uncharacterized protein n=1 Tax=Auritidibacter ignavus TaxID=678932 RepID=A0AAJ6AKB0_9MICC|nr:MULTISPECIES: hypothetical protein [Auritidibacter]PXA76789.1 hypothetical protein DCC26_08995 [Auritidibacter sp. NML120779]AXR74446.1 hypothetical protein DCC27_009255 [Auritidibacter sp. NML130574]NIH72706.1 hypothetical protein [Auritidibacter ignavus]PXA76501.1 hypothetical protein DCC24_06910 [Auritidibacter sp. NML100628]PXA79315.1 hypothetical protein DCC25_09230 [Auritidibacter sp. NML120636]